MTPASCSVQSFSTRPETSSGPAAFLGLTALSVGLTSHSEVGPVVGDMLDSLPHLPAVVAVQAVLYPPPVVQLGPLDASLQVSTGCAVESHITRPEGGIPLLKQPLDLTGHPGLLTGIDPNLFVHCDNVCAVLTVKQDTVSEHLQVWMVKNVPAGPVKAVLQLLRSSIRPNLNSFCGGDSSFPEGGIYAGIVARLAQVW